MFFFLNQRLQLILADLLGTTHPELTQVLAGGAGVELIGAEAATLGSADSDERLVRVEQLGAIRGADSDSVALVDENGGGGHGSVPFGLLLGYASILRGGRGNQDLFFRSRPSPP